MTKDAPAFDFYPERFWFAVEGWTESETCRYWRLLGQQWMRDGLPADERELAGLARGKLSERVLGKFPVADDGKRRNAFLEQLRNEQRDRIAKRRDGAAKTNAKRWSGKSDSESPSGRSANRSATRLATIERVDSESPPPTTHPHPIISNEMSTPLPPRGGLSEDQITVGGWYGRKATTRWDEKELKAWKKLTPDLIADGLAVLTAPYSSKATYRRKDLLTLLNNWRGEIDRWQYFKAPQQSNVTSLLPGPVDADGNPEWLNEP
jgi:hypothetical protein